MVTSDRLAVMAGGRIEQVGTPADVYDNPVSEFVAAFLGVSNLLSAWWMSVVPKFRGYGWRMAAVCSFRHRG